MSRLLAIINPSAGNGAARRAWARIQSHVPAAAEWERLSTRAAGHARELAAAAVGVYDRIVVVGGDGTASEVAHALAHAETELALIPAGTGNDLAANLGVPSDPLQAAMLAASGSAQPIDLGEIQQPNATRYFANIAGFGFDAEVAWRVNRLPKFGGGTLPYMAGVLLTLWRYRAAPLRLELDGRPFQGRVFLVAIANCASYGGGMRIAPDAQPSDGLFDVCIVKDLPRLEVLRLLPKLYSGGHVSHPRVEIVRCREVSAAATGRVLCQSDGELAGALPARFAIRAGALRCVMPMPPARAQAAPR